MENIAIFGATGSIGRNTLAVLRQHPERFCVYALSGYRNMPLLAQQIAAFQPRIAIVADEVAAQELQQLLGSYRITILTGTTGLCTVAQDPQVDTVVAAIVGVAGLESTFAAAQAGKRILLANKESLVAGGQVFLETVHRHQATLLPIDSEHNAILQCLPTTQRQFLQRIVLTASGGPFRDLPLEDLEHVTVAQACHHPNWKMGQKISIDSATMANKGLEVIEAYYLFGLRPEQIEVLIQPQSIIHSMVEYQDGSFLAQLGPADMRVPISYALAYPERIQSGVEAFDLRTLSQLDFRSPDYDRFPCLRWAFEALRQGPVACIAFNASNEVLVQSFIDQRIGFMDIARGIQVILSELLASPLPVPQSLQDILQYDTVIRERTWQWVSNDI